MYIKKIFQITLIATAFTLTACSSTKPCCDNTTGFNDGQGPVGTASATGLGEGTTFANNDSGFNTDPMKVGNQSYYFDFDKSTVRTSDTASLQVQARYLAAHPDKKVLLTGNTDERGSREYNVGLGEHRDMSVEQMLIAAGVNKDQITTVSYGSEKPAALGHDESAYSKNRRVDLIYRSAIG